MDWLRAFKRKKDDEDQDHEHLLVAEEEIHAERHRDHVVEQELQRDWVDGFLTIVLLLTIILFAYSIVLYWQAKQIIATDTQCTKRMSGYSPMLDSIDYERIQWHAEDFPDEYSGRPTLEVESAWNRLFQYNNFGFPRENLEALNKSSSRQYISTGDKNDGEVVGLLEGFHQMHCLNLIRKYIYRDDWNYTEYDYAFQKGEWHLRTHVDHCMTIIKESITCASDVTPVLFERDLEGPEVWKAHSSVQKCRRWSSIVGWVKDHRALSEDEFETKLKHPVLE